LKVDVSRILLVPNGKILWMAWNFEDDLEIHAINVKKSGGYYFVV